MLQNLILKYGSRRMEPGVPSGDTRQELLPEYVTDNLYTEAAYFSGTDTLVIVNNTKQPQSTGVPIGNKLVQVELPPYGSKVIEGVTGKNL